MVVHIRCDPLPSLINTECITLYLHVGGRFFVFIYSASYVIYRHWVEGALFVLGVMNLHQVSYGPDLLLLLLNVLFTSILYYFLQDWQAEHSVFPQFSLWSFHLNQLAWSQFFTNDRVVAPKCWLSLSTFSVYGQCYIQWQ